MCLSDKFYGFLGISLAQGVAFTKLPLNSMKQIWQACKTSLRHELKSGAAWRQGYPWYYARLQQPEASGRYPYLWSQSTTPLPPRPDSPQVSENRLWNLKLAARKVHGLVIQPQQIFSFWHRVPRPTRFNGFREGPVFVRGEVKLDFGGGLCLISTNLFNVFLLAGFEILERHHHSIDPYGSKRFFPLGRDATVAYGYKDLMVRNASTVPLQLRIAVDSERGEVTSSVWGVTPCSFAVNVTAETLEQTPAPHAEGMPGYRVKVTRYIGRPIQAHLEASRIWQPDYEAIALYQPSQNSYYSPTPTSTSI
jgi:vancomycin resistance protein VanW